MSEFRYFPEIGEEHFLFFLGPHPPPLPHSGRIRGTEMGARSYEKEYLDALALVTLVLAEMAEAGHILRPRLPPRSLATIYVPINPASPSVR